MIFSSSTFLLLFFPIFFITYYFLRNKYKNIWILAASAFFYAWGAPKFIFVIIATTIVDFYMVRWMDSSENERKRKLLLTLSVLMNMGLLVYFKYSNFFIENVNNVLSVFGIQSIKWTKLILPIGISFYTFETMTYVVDVYRRVHKPLKNFWDYQLYIILFPKLIAGPIIRYHELADQITDRSKTTNLDNALSGFIRFIIGLSKKILIANVMGAYADEIYNLDAKTINTPTAWMAALAYTFQIYFDFSGYSDMAIGLGKMMGFKFPENFNNPYTATSITDFWRRWHMTLGAWMRNYLYIPLGGNQVSSVWRLYFNLWVVFLASGLWHGASWSFIIWGAYHGMFLVFERAGLQKFYNRIGKLPAMLITFIVVVTGWVVFRVEEFKYALQFVKAMYSFNFSGWFYYPLPDFFPILVLAVLFSFFAYAKQGLKIQNKIYFDTYPTSRLVIMTLISALLLVINIATIAGSDFNPFIYFRF